MKQRILPLFLSMCLLTGCASLLEREYSAVEPHSSKFWEREAAGTLRAENYQDIVNDLLILIGQHTETAMLRLYNMEGDITVTDTLERATVEVQQETPMGAYAVEYITTSSQAQRGYYEVELQIGYRRTAEQIQAVVNTTSPEALYSLLETALDEEKTELAVRIGYWGLNGQNQVEEAVTRIREDRGLQETPLWQVIYYPQEGPVGLVEVLLEGGEMPETLPEGEEAAEGDVLTEDGREDGDDPEDEAPSEEESGAETEPPEETVSKGSVLRKKLCKSRQAIVKETGANQGVAQTGHSPA